MRVIGELKELMVKIGMDAGIVSGIDPGQTLAGRVIDSADYTAFLAAVEDRFGVVIEDRYALRLRTLNDFRNYIRPGA